MTDLAIKVDYLNKKYRIGAKEAINDTLGGRLSDFILSPLRNFRKLKSLSEFSQEKEEDVILALRDISFEVKKGEVLGIIGHNGAGKSTLLKILSRITQPTTGEIIINGRVSSLLEVGTGFHPELTGSENIYLNGTILGMKKKEVDSKFNEIVEFSGVEKFIDTPVKRYSSGMKVRLAFAVSAYLEPEILIIDEVLAVGDAEFQKRCLGKMGDVADGGRTVLFVSHNLDAVSQLCSRALLLNNGRIVFNGNVADCIDQYIGSTESSSYSYNIPKQPDLKGQINFISITTSDTIKDENILKFDSEIKFIIRYTFRQSVQESYILLRVTDTSGKPIFTTTDHDLRDINDNSHRNKGQYSCEILIPPKLLMPGNYSFVAAIHIPRRKAIHRLKMPFYFTVFPAKLDGYKKDWFRVKRGNIYKDIKWIIASENNS